MILYLRSICRLSAKLFSLIKVFYEHTAVIKTFIFTQIENLTDSLVIWWIFILYYENCWVVLEETVSVCSEATETLQNISSQILK